MIASLVPLLVVLSPIIAISISTFGAWVVVARRTSGNIAKATDADVVFKESKDLRDFYRQEVIDLRASVKDLEEENRQLTRRVLSLERQLNGSEIP